MFTLNRKVLKTIKISAQYFRMTYAKWLQYKLNFWLDTGLRFVEAALFFFFWSVLLGNQLNVGNWTMQGFLLIYFFEVLFIWVVVCFSYAAVYAWEKIVSGEIDRFLSRPTVPWAMIALEEMNPNIGAFFVAATALTAAALSGISIQPVILILGILMTFLAGVIAFFFGLTLSCAAFWFGRLDETGRLFEGFWEFEYFPSTLFPWWIQSMIAFTLPFLFAHTVPTLALLNQISAQQFAQYFLAELLVIAAWFLVFRWVWRTGLRRYESYGG